MKFFYSLFFLLCFSIKINAQKLVAAGKGVITGKVLDANTKAPIEYATITVFPFGSTKPVNGIVSNAKGVFKVDALAAGLYTVTIDFIGYVQEKNDSLLISADKPTISLGNIALNNKSAVLQNVTVTTTQSLIENKIDKMIYNVNKDLTSQGGVASDVLKKVPQVSVDIDGNVELLGSTSIRFLINGKPSTIFGNSVGDALQSIPAGQIQSI
ncbi:MAG: carboxypeptidase-like regulatory domain-containing protein, partial [Bacteroidota bacterium]|nr:carboxypeptidase-like regulatory domain-containing protein [Bacteroidota bacterium]